MFCDSIVWCYSRYSPSPLRDRIMFFSSCSLYGVSLWRNKVLTGSIPLCLERPDSDNGIYFCYQVHVCLISFSSRWTMFVNISVISYVSDSQIYLYVL